MGGELAILSAVRVVLAVLMFGYTSYKDVKTREVSDLVWIVFGGLGLVLDAYEVYTGTLGIVSLLTSVGFMVVFAFVTGYLGLFGEADLLAFVVVGLLNPSTPTLGFRTFLFEPFFFPLTVLSNSILVGASVAFVVLILNLFNGVGSTMFEGYAETGVATRLVLLLTGIRKETTAIRGPPYEYPLERVEESGAVSLIIRPDISDDEDASRTLQRLRDMGRRRVWVSYSLPFLLMLGVGYISAITLGDFALWLVSHFIH
jgi:hypothetical protein